MLIDHTIYNRGYVLALQAGNFSKALDLAFRSKQFGALQLISGELDERADPELLQRCGNFFLENEQYDKAVDLLGIGKKVSCLPLDSSLECVVI
jgi:intraflagellar transport protein 140